MTNRWRWAWRGGSVALVVVILGALAAVVALRLRQRFEPIAMREPEPVAVNTRPLAAQPFAVSRRYTGTIAANQRVRLAARVTAMVTDAPFREGATVAAGEPLVVLDAREFEREMGRLTAATQRIEADLRYWREQLARETELLAVAAIPERTRDQTQRMVDTLTAALDESRRAHEIAATRKGYTVIAAPFAGWVQAAHVWPGEMAVAGQPLVELVALDSLKVVVPIPEVDTPALRVGLPVMIEMPARADVDPVARTVGVVLPAMDARSRTATVEIALGATMPHARPGMRVVVHLEFDRRESAHVVPEQAVQIRAGETGVFVVGADDRVQWRRVAVESVHDRHAAIAGDVRPGERVVVTPDPRLTHGRPVLAMPTPDGTANGTHQGTIDTGANR